MKITREVSIWIILIIMSTAFSFAMGNRQMNLLLVGIMTITSFALFIQYPFLLKIEGLVYLLFVSILISALFNFSSFRITTLLYTLLFLLTFIYYIRTISFIDLSIETYVKILKVILIAYFVVLIIQQFSVLIGSRYIFNFILGDVETNKLNSLSPEPSHTARIITVLMYSYLCMRELKLGRPYNLIKDGVKDKWLWIIFLYPMLTMGSGFAIVMLLALLLKFFFDSNKAIYLIPVVLIIIIAFLSLKLPAVERVRNFSKAIVSLDAKLIITTDLSASVRVLPTLLYIQQFDIFNIKTWMGFGTDYSANVIPMLMPGISAGEFKGGLFPSFFFNSGLISVALLFAMIYKYCLKKLVSFDTFLLLLLIFAAGINTQLFWISIILFSTNKHLSQTYKKQCI